jgi:hypothetical protein
MRTLTESGAQVVTVKMSSCHGFFPQIMHVPRCLGRIRLKMYRLMQYGATTTCFPKMNFVGWYRALLRS